MREQHHNISCSYFHLPLYLLTCQQRGECPGWQRDLRGCLVMVEQEIHLLAIRLCAHRCLYTFWHIQHWRYGCLLAEQMGHSVQELVAALGGDVVGLAFAEVVARKSRSPGIIVAGKNAQSLRALKMNHFTP